MISIAAIIEGDGEVAALPILLRRMSAELSPRTPVNVVQPIRVRRDRFINNNEEFRRQLLLAAAKCGADGWILVVLDADDDCPAVLGNKLYSDAQKYVPHRKLSVVLANREFEAWFIAAAPSLHGRRGFSYVDAKPTEAEAPRNAKGWLRERMKGGLYREILDQPAFAAVFDLKQAHANSRSFRKLQSEWVKNVSRPT